MLEKMYSIFIVSAFLLLASILSSRASNPDLLLYKTPPLEKAEIADRPPLVEKKNSRACRVLVENKVDFHYEVIESLVLRFELPWHKFNCDISKPITFDFALYQNMFHPNLGGLIPGKKKPKFLNETEYWSWKRYFENELQYKTFDRLDGTETKAYFNELILWKDMKKEHPYDAFVDATCDIRHYMKDLKTRDNFFCLLHKDQQRDGDYQFVLGRSCFLTPLWWPKDQCNFMAVDLPKVREDLEDIAKVSSTEVSICVLGSQNEPMAAELFSKVPYEENSAYLVYSNRQYRRKRLEATLKKFGIGMDRIRHHSELDFERYHQDILKCDIVLPLKDPIGTPNYFDHPIGVRKSSGIVPSLIAYKRPALMHQDFAAIYQDFLTAPIETHDDTMESMVDALTRLLVKIHNEKMAIKATKEK